MDNVTATAPGLVAHKGLRRQILVALKTDQPLTAKELADRHRVTPNAIRRHLKELEAERLVEYGREQRGQGAPTFAYRLSPEGDALFPKRYEDALTEALTYLQKQGGREEVRRFFTHWFRVHADRLRAELGEADLEGRVNAVVDFLSREGFMAASAVRSGTLTIAEHNCAMHAVAERFPEVCESELEFLRDLLGADVERRQHIVSGCNSCEYAISVTPRHSEREESR